MFRQEVGPKIICILDVLHCVFAVSLASPILWRTWLWFCRYARVREMAPPSSRLHNFTSWKMQGEMHYLTYQLLIQDPHDQRHLAQTNQVEDL